jgi:Zn-dependent protease/predicted transcriptional regulator
MRWSWRLLNVAGIGIYVHVTFFVLLIWIGWSGFSARHRWEDALSGIAFILTLFVMVVLHELGHALTAKRFGIRTRDITLLPIGGVARLERMPEDPKQELAVALAGPAVNVVLACLLFAVLAVTGYLSPLETLLKGGGNFLSNLMFVNVMLAVFNLLPAFPMDGGRVLRALLAIRMSYPRATAIAANIGQGMAILFGLVGLFVPYPVLILIAVFVWMGASTEASMVQMKSALNGIPASRVMITDFKTLAPEDTLSRAAEYLLAGYQQDFPVMSDNQLVGVLTRPALVNGLTRLGANMPAADAMEKEFVTAHPDEPAEMVFHRLQTSPSRSVLILQNGQLLGIVTAENVGEYLMVQAALHGELRTPPRLGGRLTERHA